ncbi:MAG: hypothetical protein A3B70_07865 [Deltaproteobacteria bacterium RIFCSPHIGHO2_02_FULL_40_11]|nr:MAG: hypothetical protein A3B70_07865 [Deltaproteobacteria bacterium RIFCSPHIGHO2_02_FULL_40_11]
MQKNSDLCCSVAPQKIVNIPYPNHTSELVRLKKIKGQIEGILKMIEDGRYCVDILVQFRAVGSALLATEKTILDKHIRGCVQQALTSKNKKEIDQKIEELTALVCRN